MRWIGNVALVLVTGVAFGAVFTTRLQNNTVAAWNAYIERAERGIAAGLPMLDVTGEAPALADLNPNGDNAGEEVPNGYIHHWIGAVRIPNTTVAAVRAVLEDYENYPRIYPPDVKLASASRVSGAADSPQYDVELVSEQVESMGLHFAFDMRLHVQYHTIAGETRVDSRSYSIRESNSGRPPYADLLPEGNDHGILWRLNSYWRLRQTGTSVYAECQAISLSRKPPPGIRERIKNRARDRLDATLQQTRNRALRQTSGAR